MTHNGGIQLKILAIGFALWLGVGVLQPADAGLLYPGGSPHPNAIVGTSGTVPLVYRNNVTNAIEAPSPYGDIEFAAFTAAGFAIAFPLQDTPGGGVAAGEFVYAFQVYNNGARGDITGFSAGLADIGPPTFPFQYGDGDDDNEEVASGGTGPSPDQNYILGTGQAPNVMTVPASVAHGAANGSSVKFNFVGAAASKLNSGEISAVLYYTSPYPPGWDNGSVTPGSGQHRIPAPEVPSVPEPSCLALAALAMIGLAACGRRRGRM